MWTPQAVVAVILAITVLAAVCGAIAIKVFGIHTQPLEHETRMWEMIMSALIGGLMAWIGSNRASRRKEDRDGKE